MKNEKYTFNDAETTIAGFFFFSFLYSLIYLIWSYLRLQKIETCNSQDVLDAFFNGGQLVLLSIVPFPLFIYIMNNLKSLYIKRHYSVDTSTSKQKRKMLLSGLFFFFTTLAIWGMIMAFFNKVAQMQFPVPCAEVKSELLLLIPMALGVIILGALSVFVADKLSKKEAKQNSNS